MDASEFSSLDILVIEDDESIRSALQLFFDLSNKKALFLKTAPEARSWLKKNPKLPPLTLVDRRLGGENGLDLIRSLRTVSHESEAIYLFSADRVSPREARQFGATGILPKPFDAQALLSLMNKHLPN